MAVTIIDVAHEACVSKSTVSLVINNSKAIKPKTRQRVLEAIDKLGYVADISARGLSTKRRNILGIIYMIEEKGAIGFDYNHETEVFGNDISIGIAHTLSETDYGLLTERFYYDDSKTKLPECVRNKRVDGIVIIGGLFDDRFIDRLRDANIPMVIVGRRYPSIDSVTADITCGARLSVEHLISTGHRRICYVNCPKTFFSHHNRKDGFEEAIALSQTKPEAYCMVYTDRNSGHGGYQAIAHVYDSLKPDGVAVANDTIALGVVRFLYERSIRIPDDVSIVSYENSIMSAYASPALSTIDFDKVHMGEDAALMLLSRIRYPDAPVKASVLPVRLLKRDSVKDRAGIQ